MPRWVEAAVGWIGEGDGYPNLSTTTTSLEATPRMVAVWMHVHATLLDLARSKSLVMDD